MSDPTMNQMNERLRAYYRSIQKEPPASLEASLARTFDRASSQPVPGGFGGLRWRPAFGLAAAAVGVVAIVSALVLRQIGPLPAPSPSGPAGPTASPSASTSPTANPCPPPGSPSPGVVETPSATPSPTLSPTPKPSAAPTSALACDFVLTGAMNPVLSGPAVLLPTGKVLVMGGLVSRSGGVSIKTDQAELYDPASHTFTPTGSMTAARFDFTATLLRNGRVLVVGGSDMSDGIDNLASAELYDPSTGKFTATGSMVQGRAGHTATLLNDGRVLIAGGFGGGTQPVASAEIYDPATGKFSSTGSMTVARQNHTATLLPGGKVLIAGGIDDMSHVLASAELYNPATGTFTAAGSMTTAREWHAAVSLGDGRVLVTGGVGSNQTTVLASAEIYDSASGHFAATGSMSTRRYGHIAIQQVSGYVVIIGGNGVTSLEGYWPNTGQFGDKETMPGQVYAAALLGDGNDVLLTGGKPSVWGTCGEISCGPAGC
jgi:hypothetical protein